MKADYINEVLAEHFQIADVDRDLLHNARVAQELKNVFPALKDVVAKGVQYNAIIPSLSATLDSLKYSTNTVLPTTQFYDA